MPKVSEFDSEENTDRISQCRRRNVYLPKAVPPPLLPCQLRTLPSTTLLPRLVTIQVCIAIARLQATRAVKAPVPPFPIEHDAAFLHQLATAVEFEVLPAPNVHAAVAVGHAPFAVRRSILPLTFIRAALVWAMYGCGWGG